MIRMALERIGARTVPWEADEDRLENRPRGAGCAARRWTFCDKFFLIGRIGAILAVSPKGSPNGRANRKASPFLNRGG